MGLQYGLLSVLIGIAFYTDVRTAIISNHLTLGVTLFAFGLNTMLDGWEGFVTSIVGFSTGLGLFMVLYVCKAIGAGDVKLFGAIGAVMGIHFTLHSMMYSIIYAGLIGLLILLFRKRLLAKIMHLYHWLLWVLVGRSFTALDYSAHHAVVTFPFMYAVVPAVVTTSIISI